jgi:hypothetical protein
MKSSLDALFMDFDLILLLLVNFIVFLPLASYAEILWEIWFINIR